MQIELTEKEFRRLLDMAYIGNWILNSTRGSDRFEDYDKVESRLFSYCKDHGMASLTENLERSAGPLPALPRAASTRPLWTMRTRCSRHSGGGAGRPGYGLCPHLQSELR